MAAAGAAMRHKRRLAGRAPQRPEVSISAVWRFSARLLNQWSAPDVARRARWASTAGENVRLSQGNTQTARDVATVYRCGDGHVRPSYPADDEGKTARYVATGTRGAHRSVDQKERRYWRTDATSAVSFLVTQSPRRSHPLPHKRQPPPHARLRRPRRRIRHCGPRT